MGMVVILSRLGIGFGVTMVTTASNFWTVNPVDLMARIKAKVLEEDCYDAAELLGLVRVILVLRGSESVQSRLLSFFG